ncbi:hypothetical protein PIB30_074414 [Stylosanthes scabra]|uniref:Uncharacterized protein n=1 Tax=Stylosanthes scabra TaxID=79078 RepID=A0ABU6UP21_9FABA|nr:hypothetical protein [Stylosanthes scabra]
MRSNNKDSSPVERETGENGIILSRSKVGRRIDRWYPTTYQCWYGLWATRFAQIFEVAKANNLGPSADFLRWWFLAGKRYLAAEDAFHHFPPDEIPIEATQRQSAPQPQRFQIQDVPDNRRLAR